MKRNIYTNTLIWVLAALLAAPFTVLAQNTEGQKTFSRAELDQMLAPIALYPDSLLAQVLIGATYPDQVVEADRWVKDHPDLKGDALNAELDKMDWDLSVKALAPFPQVLAMMDDQLDWTRKLGEAFMAQEKEVMASIQGLRSKAYAQGNLKTTDQQKVTVAGEAIEIEPAQSDVVYVPYYDPAVIYGDWWWPAYPPYAYFPFAAAFITAGLFGWGWGFGVGPFWNWGWGSWNWGGGNVFVNVNRNININDRHAHINRNTMRTDSFHHMASTGRIGGIGTARAGGGRTGVGGRTGAGGRPSAASVERGLSHGRTGVSRGGSRGTANTSRGGTSRGTSRGTGSVSRGGSRGTANTSRGGTSRGTSRGTGNVSRGGGMRHENRDIGSRGGAARGGAPHFGGGGGGHGGGGGSHGGGGGGHGGGGGGHGGGGGKR